MRGVTRKDPGKGPAAGRRCRPWCRGVLYAALGLWGALPVSAELVIFTHGGFMKVDAFEVVGNQVLLDSRGGQIRVPLLRVERILEDEIVVAEPLPEPPPAAFKTRFDPEHQPPSTPFASEIFAAAQKHDLNPTLVAAVVRAESAFDSGAVSVKGAQGLMQLMPATASRFGLGPGEAFDPVRNLEAGSRYLSWLLNRFDGEITHALAAYNSGEGTVDRYGGVPPYRETRHYLRRIFTELGLPVDELPEP